MIRITLLFLSTAFLTGCASITIHTNGFMSDRVSDPRYDSPTPIYGGVTSDFIELGKGLAAPFRCSGNPNVHWYDIGIVPVALVDAPLSFAVDTLWLPSDIWFWPRWAADVPGKRFRSGEDLLEWMRLIEQYQKLSNRLPENFGDIVKARKGGDTQLPSLEDPWGHEYFYVITAPGRFSVGTLGEDGLRGTDDDIVYKCSADRQPPVGADGRPPAQP